MNDIALQKNLREVVENYDKKAAALEASLAAHELAGRTVQESCTMYGTYGQTQLDIRSPSIHRMKENLLKSAWLHVYGGLNISRIATPKDKSRWEQGLQSPAPFTLENIRATFGDYILNPRANILRGLAEVFCNLDPAYKSHDKVRIGVKGLPKRVILRYVTSYRCEQLESIINALAAIQSKPLVAWKETSDLWKDGESMKVSRGITIKTFDNGNVHVHFEPDTLVDINMGLAEYYGDALADDSQEPAEKPQASRAVAKDLQYYPTPEALVERVLDDVYSLKGAKVLEPSCGCGRLLDGLRKRGADALGIEYDFGRAQQARAKGHKVMQDNFLEVTPTPIYDKVVMNPPFYGKHYAKHIAHALKFLKPEGELIAILPVTARYDHGLVNGRWQDMPIGSFAESGTNINTTMLKIWKRDHMQTV